MKFPRLWSKNYWIQSFVDDILKRDDMKWFMEHRRVIGGFLIALGTALRAIPEIPHIVIEIFTIGGTFITGTGVAPSDTQVKAKNEFIESGGLDKRSL